MAVRGGEAGCQEIFDGLLARDFSNVAYFAVHRMLVDTYALQHPDRYCASAKSLAAHLTGLCWLVEHSGSRAVGSEALRRWLNGGPQLEKPEVPSIRGWLTIGDLPQGEDPGAHAQAVDRWARSAWEAYSALHPLARQWIQQALAVQSRAPRR